MSLRVALALSLVLACHDETPTREAPQTIHCAVIGGMTETGFWNELAARYQRLTGHTIEITATGPKAQVVAAFRKGGIDVITVHASDAIVNLVADGLAVDPQPWLRNDLVIVGPADDPAHVRGEPDALIAVQKIAATHNKLLVHASMGADGVLHDLTEGHPLPPETTVLFGGENQHEILERAAAEHAYTLVGRIPFISGKLRREGIELMVRGDPRLRRPYLVAVAAHASAAARDFAAYLRAPETQAWIATFGKGKYDAEPLFYPIVTN